MTHHDLARWRLRSQSLVAPHAESAADAVRSLLAVQAENPSQAAWAVACRTRHPDRRELDGLLADGLVVRTHVLRPTWHFVSAEDIGWLLELTSPRVRPLIARQLARLHAMSATDLDRATSVVLTAVAQRPDRTRDELALSLRDHGLVADGQRVMHLLALLELDGLLCSGRPRAGAHTYSAFGDRVPRTPGLDRDEALGRLAVRYFTGHGPATERDLAYWASLTLGEVRRGLAIAASALDSFEHDGRVFWHAAGEPPTGGLVPAGHLLQILDEVYRGYQDSRMVLDSAGVVPGGRETALGIALVDGRLVARMKRTLGRRAVFELTPYAGPLLPEDRAALEQAAQRYAAFLGLEPEVRVR